MLHQRIESASGNGHASSFEFISPGRIGARPRYGDRGRRYSELQCREHALLVKCRYGRLAEAVRAMEGREEPGGESIAGADRVGDLYASAGSFAFESAGKSKRPVLAAGDDDKPGAPLQPIRGESFRAAPWRHPGEILIAHLDDVCHRHDALDPLPVTDAILDEIGADIGIEVDDSCLIFPPAERLEGRAAGFEGQRKGSEMKGDGVVGPVRPVR